MTGPNCIIQRLSLELFLTHISAEKNFTIIFPLPAPSGAGRRQCDIHIISMRTLMVTYILIFFHFQSLKEASDVISESPAALQLRYLQTLTHISAEKNSTIVFPLPIDMMQVFMKK